MLASTAASLRPPLRRFRGGGAFPFGTSHGGLCGANVLFPRPRQRALACRADLQQDAPFAAAIGACVLASLVLPPPRPRGEDGEEAEEGGEFGATDTRMAVMGIISFLPYFNWLSWIFAWLDSGRRRYLVYAAVYLAPYLRWLVILDPEIPISVAFVILWRISWFCVMYWFTLGFPLTNLSLSSDESWLPIASIFICILHIQLEAGIRSGDIESFNFVKRAWKLIFPSPAKEKDGHHGNKTDSIGMGDRRNRRIPSAHESRERLRNSDIFKRKLDEPNEEKQNKSDWD
ncbi:uncharacterized protein C2845_PM15G19810 [Panicum miliaceum]|uniref:Uncharacterized protein n=1 Tax=Panicum miliaceum TaxID=4540 RepID=A0A3L6QBM0_PANMI|nr:uncharacterized protein C2845_PM15G19810 [Panicum miliaceum]